MRWAPVNENTPHFRTVPGECRKYSRTPWGAPVLRNEHCYLRGSNASILFVLRRRQALAKATNTNYGLHSAHFIYLHR